jgi:hypothetical protein
MTAQPMPEVWPVCTTHVPAKAYTEARTCDTPFVLRRGLSMSKGWIWVWSRDCKHKGPKATYELHDENGRLDPQPEQPT